MPFKAANYSLTGLRGLMARDRFYVADPDNSLCDGPIAIILDARKLDSGSLSNAKYHMERILADPDVTPEGEEPPISFYVIGGFGPLSTEKLIPGKGWASSPEDDAFGDLAWAAKLDSVRTIEEAFPHANAPRAGM